MWLMSKQLTADALSAIRWALRLPYAKECPGRGELVRCGFWANALVAHAVPLWGCLLLMCLPACRSSESTAASSQSHGAEAIASQEVSGEPASEPGFAEQLAQVQQGRSQSIRLTQSAVTEQQLSSLGDAGKLLELQLDAGGVSDAAVSLLNGLAQLEHLRLRHSPLSDEGIEKLDPGSLTKLKVLNLPQANLSSRGLRHLAKFPELVQLRLAAGSIDDDGAEVLADFPALKSLHLIGPRFTDKALESLARAPKLSSLYIDDCRLSDEAWLQLFKAKPALHVHVDQQHHDRDPQVSHDGH
jgi:hypothetical protein